MNFDPTNLFITGFFSLVGCAFFVYGKKQTEMPFLLAGLALMVYPYFIGDVLLTTGIGLVLTAAPFIVNRLDL